MDGQPPLVQTLASPERGGAPKGRRGFASPELRIFDSWEVPRKGGTLPPLKGEGDRRRRRWWRGSSHLTVRTVPKNVRLRSLFWNGGGEINPFPEFYGNRRFALRDNYISPPLSGFARLGRCPRPRCGSAPNPTQSFTVSRSEIDDIVVEVKLSPYPLHSKG